MPIIGTKTLIEFEEARSDNRFIPYTSDISDVGEGKVELITIRGLPSNPRFDLKINSKRVPTGDGTFFVIGDQMNQSCVYRWLTVEPMATLAIQRRLLVTGPKEHSKTSVPGEVTVDGRLELEATGELEINSNATVLISSCGTLHIAPGSSINVASTGGLCIYGTVYLPAEMISQFFDSPNIHVGPMAIVKISELPGSRVYSLSDYIAELNLVYQPIGSTSARSMSAGTATASYKCMAGDIDQPSHVLSLTVETGTVILGDLDVKLLGSPRTLGKYHRSICNLTVARYAQLTIGTEFMGDTYIKPRLMIGRQFDDCQAGKLIISGKVMVTGTGSIQLYIGGSIVIEKDAELRLTGGGKLVHVDLDGNSSVIINGKLTVDDISDLGSNNHRSYVFGPEGKLVVLNPSPVNSWDRTTLLSIPNGIKSSQLYKLFHDRLECVEYHLSQNCGIAIDEDKSPMHQWHSWYNGTRLERAIAEGWLVWHDGAYLEADKSVLPWLKIEKGLGQVATLFKSYQSTARGRVQDLADRLSHAGSGNMIFRFTDTVNNIYAETAMCLHGCGLLAASYNPMLSTYGVTSTDDGELYLASPPKGTSADQIITETAKVVSIPPIKRTTFELP